MSRERSTADFEKELQVQLHLLKKSAHEFDSGDLHEVRNIARALRLLLAGDDHGNPCLIELAGRSATPFMDSRTLTHPKSLAPSFDLVGIILGPLTIGCRALLDDSPSTREANLDDWLEQPVIDDRAGGMFNRLRLIKAVANLGGGTHFPADIRDYFEKLQRLGVTARRQGETVEQKFEDVEKHSLRQIAHEVLRSMDASYRREGRFEGGAMIITGQEVILYPGRTMTATSIVKQKPHPLIVVNPPPGHGFDGISSPMIELPYEDTGRKAACPCGSGLQFRNCCQVAREFDSAFIDEFERRYKLGKYRDIGGLPKNG